MAELFKNKYRISSARLQTWDYANAGMYFITICTARRECFFGEIVETRCIASPPEIQPQMQLTEIGKTAHTEWLKSVELRPDMNLELAEFVVMPNHFHGIIMIGENKYNRGNGDHDHDGRDDRDDSDGNGNGNGRDAMHRVSTPHPAPHTTPHRDTANKFGPQSKNLGSIIRGYKSDVTTHARKNNIAFAWQPRFHDHIIRTNDEYHRIANYILNNPDQWQKDKFYTSK